MIKSMTGFASLTHEHEVVSVSVAARSVNHRYLDVQIRAPHALQALEATLRERVQRRMARGRIDVTITIQFSTRPPTTVEIDEALVSALIAAATRPAVAAAATGPWRVGELLRFPNVVTVSERARSDDEHAQLETVATTAVERALHELDRMRVKEGEFLRTDLDGRVAAFARLVEDIAQHAAAGEDELRARLHARLAELSPDAATDPTAVAQEVVRFVARSDIHEELARLRAHLGHWALLVDDAEPCGRKLDFLIQEMNREINTIGSKADGTETAECIVTAKAELEKLREQIQNIE